MTNPATDEYEIPTGDTGHEAGTFLMTLTALRPFTLYETTKGWSRDKPDDGSLVEAYNRIDWVFVDDDGEFGTGTTSTSRGERSTLFAWATGLGMAPAVVLDRSRPIPAGQLIGRDGLVTFAPDKNGYNRIKSIVPPIRQKAAAAPAAAPAAEVAQGSITANPGPSGATTAGGFTGTPAQPAAEGDGPDLPF